MSDDDRPMPGLDERATGVLRRVAAAERVAAAALPSDDPLDPERRRRTEVTIGELLAQPDVVADNWARHEAGLVAIADRVARARPARVLLTGAGDSLAVMMAARRAWERMLGVSCEPVQCLELVHYQAAGITPDTLVVALSSSGETTGTVHALLAAQAAGAMTLALTNKPQSTLAVEATAVLPVDAARIGWPTQSSTAPLALLLRLAGLIGARRGADGATALLTGLADIPELMARTLTTVEPGIREHAGAERSVTMHLFCGAGPNYASAVVGAAKVKECTPDHALAVQLEEFHHYNSQKAGEPLWLFVPDGPLTGRGIDTVHEAHRLGGHVHVVTSLGNDAYRGQDAVRSVSHVPVVDEALSPLLYFLPAQLVGYHLAMAKFAAAAGTHA